MWTVLVALGVFFDALVLLPVAACVHGGRLDRILEVDRLAAEADLPDGWP
jgi:hypothetical protein